MTKTHRKHAAERDLLKRAVLSGKATNDIETKEMKGKEDDALTGALEDGFPASDPVSSLRFTKPSKPA